MTTLHQITSDCFVCVCVCMTRSPIFAYFSSCLFGLSSIRSFSAEQTIFQQSLDLIDGNTRVYFMFQALQRWLGFILDVLCSSIISTLAFIVVKLAGMSHFVFLYTVLCVCVLCVCVLCVCLCVCVCDLCVSMCVCVLCV